MHSIEIITEIKTKVVNCNCISEFECPLSNHFQIANITYKAKITSNRQTNQGKIYYGTSVGTFKQRYGNQKKLFKHERHRTDTEHSNEF